VLRRNRESALALAGAVACFTVLALARHDVVRLRAYLQVVAILVVLTVLADRAAQFSKAMVAALTSVAIVHLVGGLAPPVGGAVTFYETWLIDRVLKFDQLAHLWGTAVLTFASWHLAVGMLKPRRRGGGLAFVAALMACGMGALNELVEFFFGLNNADFHAGGLANTGWDLAFNLAGAVIAAVLLATHPLQVDDEHERFVRTDDAAGALSAVAEIRRDR
jgi:hypothetical protein